MRYLAHTLLALIFALPFAHASAEERPFAHHGIAQDAERYETYLKANWRLDGRVPAELRAEGERYLLTNPRAASRSFAGAVVADDHDVESWMGLARALLAIPTDPNKGSERYDLPLNASGAAYLAYERAGEPLQKARALAILGNALIRRSYWRPAIDALKTSLALNDNAQVRQAYEKLRAAHGFRMVDYKTESETATPRLCLQFSETLARGQVDFSKFVSVDGKDPQGVVAEGEQLCIEGLAHGKRYEVQVRAGLPSDVDEDLQKAAEIAVYVPDRKPFVRFSGKNYVLPSRGQQGIPLVSVNTDKVEVEVYRIGDRNLIGTLDSDFQRQLSSYEVEAIKSRTGERIFSGTMDVPQKLNDEVTTALPVTDAVKALKPGVYVMIAKPTQKSRNDYSPEATQWFIVSDLGLTAFSGDDGVHAFVRSLVAATPWAGVNVKLIARNNEVLGTTKSDANGYAMFAAGLARGEGGLQPALLVAESDSGEYAFLDLTSNAFDLTDRGVKGREAPGPLDGYLYTERGVYRPGEDVHITGLVRDKAGKAASLPVTLIVTRPDGVEYRRITLTDRGLGGRELTLPLAATAMTGTWRAKLHADPDSDAITQVSFLVEDFVPERLDLKLEPPAAALAPEETQIIKATGRYLYGPPAEKLAIEGDIVIKASGEDVAGYPGFQFGQADERVETVRKPLDTTTSTDSQGSADIAVTLPQIPHTAKPLEANVILRLREPGGRTIERSVTIPVDLREARIGIKPLFKGQELDDDQTAAFEVALLDGKGQRAAASDLKWQIFRLDTTWQWYRRDGQWNYEPVTLTRKAADGTIAATAEGALPRIEAARLGYGRYRLEVTSTDPNGPAASVAFNAGWYSASANADSPEILDVALDRASYNAGDTAKLRIATKQGGKALIAVLSGGLLSMQETEIANGGGELDVPVGTDWGPGAYVTAMLYRPMDESLKRMPSRAIGVAWLGLDQSANTLNVALDTPEKIKSGTTLTVPVKLGGLTPGQEAHITVAAVDLGILNLTRFAAPAPEDWFYAQRRMGLEIRDFYGRLIDGMRAERGTLRSGGDSGGDMGLNGSPPVEETVALYSGIVKVDDDGTASVDFDVPDFNGTVRVMAVAWSADKLGHASRDVIVRDAVALTASGPRFLTLGDEARLDIAVHNVEGPPAAYKLEVDQGAAAVHTSSLDLKTGERRSAAVTIKPEAVGELDYDIHVTGPDGIAVERHLTFVVKPPAGDIKRTTVTALKGGGGSLTLSSDLVQGLIPALTRVSLSVGPTAALDIPGLLTALDRYPYGCAEQTVSRALPLVYANAVAAELGIAPDKELKARVQKAIDRVFEMQDSSGAFGAWGPGNGDLWLTGYVTDFLTRAKEQGFSVNPQGFGQALDRLQNFIAYAQDFDKGGEDRAYALYVLARNGRAPIGELRYYADTRLDRFATPLAQAQLGAALAMMGDKTRAEGAFGAALASLDAFNPTAAYAYRADYGSDLRDSAALVTLAAETRMTTVEQPKLVNVIAKAYLNSEHTSTQEQAWMLLAANALSDQAKETKLVVNGAPVNGALLRSMTAEALASSPPLTVTNEGDAPVDAVVTVIGAALRPEPAVSKGFTIERSYFTLDGKPVDLQSAAGGASQVRQNERLVAVLKLEAVEAGGRVLLVDRLPAGFEIENPRLVDSGDVKSLSWLKTTVQPEHSEFRDDRFVAAFNFSGANAQSANTSGTPSGGTQTKGPAASATVAYMVRAVTPGSFVHPAATVEDMYRPERYARTAAGNLTVTPSE